MSGKFTTVGTASASWTSLRGNPSRWPCGARWWRCTSVGHSTTACWRTRRSPWWRCAATASAGWSTKTISTAPASVNWSVASTTCFYGCEVVWGRATSPVGQRSAGSVLTHLVSLPSDKFRWFLDFEIICTLNKNCRSLWLLHWLHLAQYLSQLLIVFTCDLVVFVFVLGLFSKRICVIVLCLYLGQCSVLLVSLSCLTACLLAFKLFTIGRIKMDRWMDIQTHSVIMQFSYYQCTEHWHKFCRLH